MELLEDRGRGLAAAVFYSVCSTSMAFLNKAVMNSYEFPFPFFIMAVQMLVTVAFLEILASLGKITLPLYTWKSARSFLAPSMGYAFHATLSLLALQGMNIPMYGAVKRCTPLVNLILAVVILRHPLPSFTLIVSVLTITIGCFVAVLGDLTFDGFAYTMGGLSVLAQGLYLTLVQRCAENHRSTLEILQLNSYNTLAPFVIMCVLVGEPEKIIQSKYITGIAMNIFGGCMYTYTKYQEKTKERRLKTEDENFNKVKAEFYSPNHQDTQDTNIEKICLSEVRIS